MISGIYYVCINSLGWGVNVKFRLPSLLPHSPLSLSHLPLCCCGCVDCPGAPLSWRVPQLWGGRQCPGGGPQRGGQEKQVRLPLALSHWSELGDEGSQCSTPFSVCLEWCSQQKGAHTKSIEDAEVLWLSIPVSFFKRLCSARWKVHFLKVHLALHSSEHIVWPGCITSQCTCKYDSCFYVILVIGVAIEAKTTTLPWPQDSGGEEREAKSYSSLLHLHRPLQHTSLCRLWERPVCQVQHLTQIHIAMLPCPLQFPGY